MSLRIDWCDHSETDDAMVVVIKDSSLDSVVFSSLMTLPILPFAGKCLVRFQQVVWLFLTFKIMSIHE
jgi:hypothetical protein